MTASSPDRRIGIDTGAQTYGVAASAGMWAAAWQLGACAADDVLTELSVYALNHVVTEHDRGPGTSSAADLLAALRSDSPPAVFFPAAGDTFGLPGSVLTGSDAAEVVVVSHLSRGPLMIAAQSWDRHTIGWHVQSLPSIPTLPVDSVAEVEFQLREATMAAATVMGDLGHIRSADADPIARVRYWEEMAGRLRCPPDADDRSERLLQQAATVDAIIRAATELNVGPGLSAAQNESADRGLRELSTTVRRARMSAVNRIISAGYAAAS